MMTMTRHLLVILCASLVVACGGSDDNNSPTAPTEVTGSAPFSTTDLVVGGGAEATSGLITVNYTGWLYSDIGWREQGQADRFIAVGGTHALSVRSERGT